MSIPIRHVKNNCPSWWSLAKTESVKLLDSFYFRDLLSVNHNIAMSDRYPVIYGKGFGRHAA
jgi:hypothetical protein